MKKNFIFLILLILSSYNHFFAAQSQQEFKNESEIQETADKLPSLYDQLLHCFFGDQTQKKIKNEAGIQKIADKLNGLYNQLFQNFDKWEKEQLDRHIEKIKDVYKAGFDVNSKLLFHRTFANLARYKKLNDLSFWLIEHGINVNKIYMYDISALIEASKFLNLDLVKKLIEHGANINYIYKLSARSFQISALSEAIFHEKPPQDKKNWKEVIKILLLNGAKIERDRFSYYTDPEYATMFISTALKIIEEYKQKIKQHINAVRKNLVDAGWPSELISLVQEYNLLKYLENITDKEILYYIVNIRYLLDELSPIQKAQFEKEQQAAQARAAASQGVDAAQ